MQINDNAAIFRSRFFCSFTLIFDVVRQIEKRFIRQTKIDSVVYREQYIYMTARKKAIKRN